MNKKIELTQQELEDLKDTIKFREKVVLQLKHLNGIPKEVTKLKVFNGIHSFLILGIIVAFVTIALQLLGGE